MTDPVEEAQAPSSEGVVKTAPVKPTEVLNQLAQLYPALFGAEFLPMKRGIFQDLLEAHPEQFDKEVLKQALAFHARSTRYLTVVAAGLPRHDLQGQAVEAMAPEHVHHALLEVFKRRQQRTREDLRPKLRRRLVQAMQASGLSPQAYGELVSSRDEATHALLEEAMTAWRHEQARDQALAQAFQASGLDVAGFADSYGLKLGEVKARLARVSSPAD